MLVLLGLALAGMVAGRLMFLVLDDPVPGGVSASRPTRASAPAAVPTPGGAPALDAARRAATVLHAWDADRAAAYARGDPAALRRLYVPGSRAAARDLHVLRAYAARGLVVRGLRTQVLSLRVLRALDDRLRIEVTDRLVGGRAQTQTKPLKAGAALPWDAPSTRVLVLRGDGGTWRMRSVRPA